jgi:phospholipase/carboxylesterase
MTALSYLHRYEAGSDSSAPPLLLLHGTGGDENDLIPLARKLSPVSALLSPRGDVLEQGMPRFFKRFAEGVFDLADVGKRTQAMADFIAAAARQYGFDPARLIALGFSNGANIASSLLLLRPESLAGAVLLRPMVVLEPARVPDLSGKRVLISSGTMDPIVPPDHPARLAAIFRQAGATVTLHTQAGGHGLVQGDLTSTAKFLAGP